MALQSKRATAVLVGTHALALLVGMGVGYWRGEPRVAETRSAIEALAERPLVEAADLAFRFGTLEHARALHTGLREGDTLSVYFSELKLAFLDREHVGGASKDTHLVRAAAACKRFGMRRCDIEHVRRSAGKLAERDPSW